MLLLPEYDELAGVAKGDIDTAGSLLERVIMCADGGWNSSVRDIALQRLAECLFWAKKL